MCNRTTQIAALDYNACMKFSFIDVWIRAGDYQFIFLTLSALTADGGKKGRWMTTGKGGIIPLREELPKIRREEAKDDGSGDVGEVR